MITTGYLILLAVATFLAFRDWRRAMFLVVICGVLQDPVRKLTPGSPAVLTYSVMVVFAAAVVGARWTVRASAIDLARRFPALAAVSSALLIILGLQMLNGLSTYGLTYWKVPVLSLLTYLAPLPAVLLAYAVRREDSLWKFFVFYAVVTSIALTGTVLEYYRVDSRALGVVSFAGDWLRHMPGIQIRMLSGFYRAPDVMAWHAATLTCISLGMVVARGIGARSLPWIFATAWGFLNCLLSGRRKAIFYVAAFVVVLLWRYLRRFTAAEAIGFASVGILMVAVFANIASNEATGAYAAGTRTTPVELLVRAEGGVAETFRQTTFIGLGLGAATQGIQHISGGLRTVGWQEGGLAKLAVEIGLPGILAALVLAGLIGVAGLRLTSIGDIRGTSQIGRVILFSLAVANAANFAGSAQAYVDPLLTILTASFFGWLLATASLDERYVEDEGPVAPAPTPPSARLVSP